MKKKFINVLITMKNKLFSYRSTISMKKSGNNRNAIVEQMKEV